MCPIFLCKDFSFFFRGEKMKLKSIDDGKKMSRVHEFHQIIKLFSLYRLMHSRRIYISSEFFVRQKNVYSETEFN